MADAETFSVWFNTLMFVLLGSAGLCAALLIALSPTPRARLPSEETYIDAAHQTDPRKLTSVNDPAEVSLSVVIPAYNERERLPEMLTETITYLQDRKKRSKGTFTYEILIVNDGSKDDTVKVALETGAKYKTVDLRILRLEKNRGKGGAVSQGMQFTRGKLALFVDADGASKFSDISLLEDAIKEIETDGFGVAVGSRAHMVQSDAVVKRSFIRNLLMHGFHRFLYLLGIRSIKDTQCGFKLFTRKSAAYIFPSVHVEGWIFDVEVLLLAERWKMPIKEVPITWHEVGGSKINLISDSIAMAKDLIVIRANYLLGNWVAIEPKPKKD